MAGSLQGRLDWRVKRDQDGHRNYDIQWLVRSHYSDGPAEILATTNLPRPGSHWAFGGDLDLWAFCSPECEVRPVHTREKGEWWIVDQKFTTRPFRRCQDTQIENPIFEPYRLNGSFVRYMKEAKVDRHGEPLVSSSHELFKGAPVEFEECNFCLRIQFNSLLMPLAIVTPLMNNVNDNNLWGLPKRTIKFSNFSFERLLWGVCNYYYSIEMEFDIDFRTHDRDVPDEGTRCLIGWNPGSRDAKIDPLGIDADTGEPNWKLPKNFVAYVDKFGNPARVLLDGKGRPIGVADDPFLITIEKYEETNLLMLGIPSSF